MWMNTNHHTKQDGFSFMTGLLALGELLTVCNGLVACVWFGIFAIGL